MREALPGAESPGAFMANVKAKVPFTVAPSSQRDNTTAVSTESPVKGRRSRRMPGQAHQALPFSRT